MKNTYTHIEEAIKLYEKIYSYNLEIYIEIITNCIGSSKKTLKLFCEILGKVTMEDNKLYYKQNSLDIYTNPTEIEIQELGLQAFKDVENDVKSEMQQLPDELQKTRIDVLVKAFFLTKAMLPEALSQIDSNEELIKTLKTGLHEEDITLLTQYSLLKADTPLLNRKIIKISSSFFYNLAKSILNGEYLILQDYSLQITNNIQNTSRSEEGTNSVVHLYFEKSYIYFANYANEMCYRVGKILENKHSNHVHLEIGNDNSEIDLGDTWGHSYIGENIIRPFDLFIKSIINMTIIDHAYKTKDSNISDLLVLRKRIKYLDSYLSKRDYADAQEVDDFKKVFKMVQIKLSNLLLKMLNQRQEDEDLELDYYFTFGNENLNEIVSSIRPYIITDEVENENLFIKTRKEHFNIEISETKREELFKKSYPFSKVKDVSNYNKYVKEGIKSYCIISSVMEKIKEHKDENVINAIIQISKKDVRTLTPPLFVKAIKYLAGYIENLTNEYKKDDDLYIDKLNLYVQTLSNLLNQLDRFITQFSKSVPYRYLPPFEYSFYEINNKDNSLNIAFSNIEIEATDSKGKLIIYNKENFKDKFFFASVGCTPMNIEYLERFSRKYNTKRRDYSRDYYNLVDDRIKNSIKESKTQTVKVISLEKKYMDDVTEQRHQTMQILGIFAAFLAFVTITVGLIKVATTIHEFLLFCTAFTLSLLLFATHLRNYARCKQNDEKQKDESTSDNIESKSAPTKKCCTLIHNFFAEHLLIIFLAFILFVMLFFIPIKEGKKENTPAAMEQTLIIDRNSPHNSIYNNHSDTKSSTKIETYNN